MNTITLLAAFYMCNHNRFPSKLLWTQNASMNATCRLKRAHLVKLTSNPRFVCTKKGGRGCLEVLLYCAQRHWLVLVSRAVSSSKGGLAATRRRFGLYFASTFALISTEQLPNFLPRNCCSQPGGAYLKGRIYT